MIVKKIFPPDRVYAKEILNSIDILQAVTNRERAQIAPGCVPLSAAVLRDVLQTAGSLKG